ncbi:NAD(P)-dependent oxidoreductase [Roseomonas sp. E05]|uniref:NAD(P)-dependent oxidoreductase n=1 Tax=Roseomonas sp. E05 TaxID=3046310 RepID=UPI0024BAC95B|nr:NAD(P)-dependent oxidoreductase [Roseomonas sp. E05]MDJ0388342.1 NAD(P)-dependent oxidoreductase [Roseomonas sp. E05]
MKVFLTHTEAAFPRYYGERALAALRQHAEVARNTTGRVLEGAALAEAAAGCQAIVADRATPGQAATFAAAPDLVAFLRCAVDISTIDVPAASQHGVLVTHATPGFTEAVAELGLGMMLDLARGISDAVVAGRAGQAPQPRQGRQLSGATLGLIGYGRIAQRLGQLGQACGMRVLAYDPHVPDFGEGVTGMPLEGVLAEADFVVCLAVASPETAGMMNARTFGLMRKGAFFVNLARGGLVDEAALEAALDSGHLAGAALDVGSAPDQMPPPRLARRPDVIATPHVGGLTREATEHQAMDTVRQVAALAEGRLPEGAANAEAAHRLERLRRA